MEKDSEVKKSVSMVVSTEHKTGGGEQEHHLEEQMQMAHNKRSARPGLGRRMGGRRVITGLATHWVSPHKELAQIEEKYGKKSWQAKAFRFIHSQRVQHTLMALLLLDVIILFVEIFLAAQYPDCYFIERDGINCCAVTEEGGDHGGELRFLAEDHHSSYCDSPLESSPGQVGCNSHKYPAVHTAHDVLFSLTIAILSLFMAELLVLLAILGPRRFFTHRLYVLDFFIVAVSLVLEITFRVIHEDDIGALLGLLVIGRIWRFVRIGHGLFASTFEVSMHKVEELETQVAELKALIEASSGAAVVLPPHPSH